MTANGSVPESGNVTPSNMSKDHNEEYKVLYNQTLRPLLSTAGTNTITGQTTPPLSAYADGNEFRLVPVADNTGAVTLNVDAVGSKALKHANGAVLGSGELKAGTAYLVMYLAASDEFRVIDTSITISPITKLYEATGTWTKPSGLAYIEVVCIGSGGESYTGDGTAYVGGGGGACATKMIAANDLPATVTVTVDTESNQSFTTFGTFVKAQSGKNQGVGGLASASVGDFFFDGDDGTTWQGGCSGRAYSRPSYLYGTPGYSYGGGAAPGDPGTTGYAVRTPGANGAVIITEYY